MDNRISNEFLITMRDGREYVHRVTDHTTIAKITEASRVSGGLIIPKTVGHMFLPNEDITNIEISCKTDLIPRDFLKKLSYAYAEKRSDVSEIIDAYLKNNENKIYDYQEHRYVRALIPGSEGIEIEYDTLTTCVEFHRPKEQWQNCNYIVYYDDEAPDYENYYGDEMDVNPYDYDLSFANVIIGDMIEDIIKLKKKVRDYTPQKWNPIPLPRELRDEYIEKAQKTRAR